MSRKDLMRWLDGVETSDADVYDGIFGKIGGAFKGAVQGWKNATPPIRQSI